MLVLACYHELPGCWTKGPGYPRHLAFVQDPAQQYTRIGWHHDSGDGCLSPGLVDTVPHPVDPSTQNAMVVLRQGRHVRGDDYWSKCLIPIKLCLSAIVLTWI